MNFSNKLNEHKEGIIVGIVALLILGYYHFAVVPQMIDQARTEVADSYESQLEEKQQQIDDLEAQIGDYENQLNDLTDTNATYLPAINPIYDDINMNGINDNYEDQLEEQQRQIDRLKREQEERRYQQELDDYYKRVLPPEYPRDSDYYRLP